jgi:hypothetical protein
MCECSLTTFWYELDRSACKAKFRRSRHSYLEKLVNVISNASKNSRLSVMAFVESKSVKMEILSIMNIPEDADLANRIIVKPLSSWEKVINHNECIKAMLKSWTGSKETPETFDSLYVCLNLSKIDAVLIHAQNAKSVKNHMWIDGGFRWNTEILSNSLPNWPENKVYFSESKPFQLMGGIFGGSIQELENLSADINRQIPFEISKSVPFTDQTIYRELARKNPTNFVRVPLYSKGLVGNYFFGSAFLDQMLPAMIKGKSWEKERPSFAKSEGLLILLSFILILITPKLFHKRS